MFSHKIYVIFQEHNTWLLCSLCCVCVLSGYTAGPLGNYWHNHCSEIIVSPWLQGSWGQHGAHLGPIGPKWAPCWPHEPWYLGCYMQWNINQNAYIVIKKRDILKCHLQKCQLFYLSLNMLKHLLCFVFFFPENIWVRSRNCGCLVTWFCYQLTAKPGNKTAAVPYPHPFVIFQEHTIWLFCSLYCVCVLSVSQCCTAGPLGNYWDSYYSGIIISAT